jgi:hypothetical protein
MSVMENLLKDVNRLTQIAAEPELSFYSCQACGDTYRSERMRETCPGCKAAARQWPGSTADEARGRAKRAAGVAPSTTNPPEVPDVHNNTPQQTEVSAGETAEAASEFARDAGSNKSTEQPKPRAKRTIKTKAEAAPVVEAATPGTAPADAETDYRAAREARIAAFIEKHALNEFQPVPVGTATVQTVGYTLWVGGKPIFRLKESFETGREFAADYNAARAEQPATRIDVAACNKVSDPELEACLYKGDLIVSLNSGHGTETVKPGDTIKIGAYRTRENRLRFAII